MELSPETRNAIEVAFNWFCAGGELSKEAEEILSAHIQTIVNIAVEPEIQFLASECRDYWNGYIVTDVSLYPRLGQWRMNGMFTKLCAMAMIAGLATFEDQPETENSPEEGT
jgi:hypothetical protein